MPSFSWNSEEDAALLGLPLLVRVIYLQGLKKHMDYQTGIVGIKRCITYRSLADVVHVAQLPGSHNATDCNNSIMAIRNAVHRLEKEGLVERKTKDRKLIFHLPKATKDQAKKHNENRVKTEEQQRVNNRPEPSNGAGQEERRDRGERVEEQQRNNRGTTEEQQTSSNRPKPSNDAAQSESKTRGTTEAKPPRNNSMSVYPLRVYPSDIHICANSPKNCTNDPPAKIDPMAGFEDWWNAYAKKINRKKCEAKWKREGLAEKSAMLVADARRRHAKDSSWINGFQPHPLTYLNGERWNDEIQRDNETHRRLRGSESSVDRAKRIADEHFGRNAESPASSNASNVRRTIRDDGSDTGGSEDVGVTLEGEFRRER